MTAVLLPYRRRASAARRMGPALVFTPHEAGVSVSRDLAATGDKAGAPGNPHESAPAPAPPRRRSRRRRGHHPMRAQLMPPSLARGGGGAGGIGRRLFLAPPGLGRRAGAVGALCSGRAPSVRRGRGEG